MAKADLSRDYYGDLEISPTADVAEIKKQFKKLALTYHPDRNPGRESEVTAKFQLIQSAHEILIDAAERARYDSQRQRYSAGSYRSAYTGGTSAGTRGNPWSGVSSQFPTPPKHPTTRKPPPSTGARRYEKFATPNQSAYQAQQEGAEGRRSTYAAWENLRHANNAKTETGPGKSWRVPQPPPRGTPKSGRDESNAQTHAPPPKTRPGYEEFREAHSSHGRSQSSNTANKKGFMPNTPGGDEPAAPKGAYFTQRNKSDVPPIPPREPYREPPQEPNPDPLRTFRDKTTPTMDGRQSQPYATHGGEKFSLFESAGMSRSNSTRTPTGLKTHVPRTGSDPNLNSPQRAKSFADRPNVKRAPRQPYGEDLLDDSSSDGIPRTNETNGFASRASERRTERSNGASSKETGKPAPMSSESSDAQMPPPSQSKPASNGGPSMYAAPRFFSVNSKNKQDFGHSSRLPTVSENISSDTRFSPPKLDPLHSTFMEFPNIFSSTPPSGNTNLDRLNAFEESQRSLVDQLIQKRSVPFSNEASPEVVSAGVPQHRAQSGQHSNSPHINTPQQSAKPQSLSKKRKPFSHLPAEYSFATSERTYALWDNVDLSNKNANPSNSSFSFPVNDDTFVPTQPRASFSNSAENISTKFTPEDWDGKFAAGGDYFKPDLTATHVPLTRAQSGSRTRGRSPTKVRPTIDPRLRQARVDSETPCESPGGTTFSPEEWAETFKPQTFMPPTDPGPHARTMPGRKRTNPTVRMTMGGNAAVVDDSSTADEKPLFNDRRKPVTKPPSPVNVPTPEPMDVDMDSPLPAVPQFMTSMAGKGLNINTEPLKRPAASASASPTDAASLKVDFEDLKLEDLMNTINIPIAPSPPPVPSAAPEFDRPTRAAYEDYEKRYAAYMKAWDHFNSKFLLHMFTRKRVEDSLGDKRWLEDSSIDQYRMSLREDQAVLQRWSETRLSHEKVVKDFVVMRERMKTREEREGIRGDRPSPRKKTH